MMTKNDKKQIVTTIDPTMMEAIDELVSTTGISKSGLVRRVNIPAFVSVLSGQKETAESLIDW